ncbi:16S rRNA (guanine(527)-N(7))-methyltransferase RsmG [Granulicella tundricola]|uniref:Ribosomal RNA small subunit methyltransferase G n=1 Tax=Granulicella tundricola (strain ATCC BAA-1859 / DSM 23138 / MP5ACTX9) TaxID=1198114 RepID=E8WWN0_GRATM|nr:16S rRNA (guanine(527)-N(7))-methyltransferase RsmG [Granulicella tundricola]ADW70775.1 methyltransferase GidB [Granulicella tundricola MP5ACTX9]
MTVRTPKPMPTLPKSRIAALLAPYYPATDELITQLSDYLDLLLRWNARTNLTAIRDPEEIVTRHFGESLFAAANLPEGNTLLDLGSGAGFPGLPIQLAHLDLLVTLAESQNKKSTFLREAIRTLGLKTQVHAARAETLTAPFDIVTLRAVDDMQLALAAALPLASNAIVILTTTRQAQPSLENFTLQPPIPLPNALDHQLLIALRSQ